MPGYPPSGGTDGKSESQGSGTPDWIPKPGLSHAAALVTAFVDPGVSPIWPISAVSLIAGPNTLIGLAVSLIDVENCLFRGCGNCAWEPRKSRGFGLPAWHETTKFPRLPAETGNLETGSLQTTSSATSVSD